MNACRYSFPGGRREEAEIHVCVSGSRIYAEHIPSSIASKVTGMNLGGLLIEVESKRDNLFSTHGRAGALMNRTPRRTDSFGWRLAFGAILIAGGYAAWLAIPVVLASDLSSSVKSTLASFLAATPLLTKLVAIALLGRPTINFLRKHSFKLFRRSVGGGD